MAKPATKRAELKAKEKLEHVSMTESPMSARGNQTGHQRNLKDMAADAYNTLNEWESLNSKGASILSGILALKLQFSHQQSKEDDQKETTELSHDFKQRESIDKLTQELDPKCQALNDVIQSMEEVVSKLASLTTKAHSLRSLLRVHQASPEGVIQSSSQTIERFVDIFDTLHTMYAKELTIKEDICDCVGQEDGQQRLMVYYAMWIHQPYIDSKGMVTSLLEN